MNDAPRRIGRNESFVHRRRGHLKELRERDREKLAQVLGIPPDDLRGPATPLPSSMNGGSRSAETGIEELREPCRTYEFALRKAGTEERSPTAAPPRLPQRPCGAYSNKRIRALQAAGAMILRDVAAGFNDQRIPTERVLERLG
jgi:hypothetical protein